MSARLTEHFHIMKRMLSSLLLPIGLVAAGITLYVVAWRVPPSQPATSLKGEPAAAKKIALVTPPLLPQPTIQEKPTVTIRPAAPKSPSSTIPLSAIQRSSPANIPAITLNTEPTLSMAVKVYGSIVQRIEDSRRNNK